MNIEERIRNWLLASRLPETYLEVDFDKDPEKIIFRKFVRVEMPDWCGYHPDKLTQIRNTIEGCHHKVDELYIRSSNVAGRL